jgi:CCR4-NOT transcriptional complex subunit CAF120
MTTFSGSPKDSPRSSPSPQPPARARPDDLPSSSRDLSSSREHVPTPDSPTSSAPSHTPPKTGGGNTSSRPGSMIFQQPLMETSRDTEPELIPIFQYLNSHANKLYQEGYFLKLNDLDTSESSSEAHGMLRLIKIGGKPTVDRNWTECFAQLVGTVLSLWDAAALDRAGQDGEVAPTFVNLADASIKMVGSPPHACECTDDSRLRHSLRETRRCNLYRTFCRSPLLAKTDISCTSTRFIRSLNGLLASGWPCSNMPLSRNSTQALL